MAFYDRLKEGRIKSGLTQEQLSEKLGIAKSTLSGYESGNREPTVATIAKALEVLGIDANFLYQDEMNELGGNPMQLQYNEMQHIEKYRDLDSHGKEMVDFTLEKEWERSTKEKKVEKISDYLTLNATHDKGATKEQKKHADDIMMDDSEWE